MQRQFRIQFEVSLSDNLKSQNPMQNLKSAGIFAIVVTFAMCGAVAEAQQPKKVHRIGVLLSGSRSPIWGEAFRQALRELGYIDGQNMLSNTAMARGYPNANPGLRRNWST